MMALSLEAKPNKLSVATISMNLHVQGQTICQQPAHERPQAKNIRVHSDRYVPS